MYRTHRRLRRGIGRDRQSSHVADVAAGSVMQSAVKKAIAAARSSTTTLTWSKSLDRHVPRSSSGRARRSSRPFS